VLLLHISPGPKEAPDVTHSFYRSRQMEADVPLSAALSRQCSDARSCCSCGKTRKFDKESGKEVATA
jgi:hypothetical protein